MKKRIQIQNFHFDDKNINIVKARIKDFLSDNNSDILTKKEIEYLKKTEFSLRGQNSLIKENLSSKNFNEICQRITNLSKAYNNRIKKINQPKKIYKLNDENYKVFVNKYYTYKESINALYGWNLLNNKDWARISMLGLVIGTNNYFDVNDNESFTRDITMITKIEKAITKYNKSTSL